MNESSTSSGGQTGTKNTGCPILFLQANVPGVTPYCAGRHVWGAPLEQFGKSRKVLTLDLPGSAGSPLLQEVPTVDVMTQKVAEFINHQKLGPVHLVGHDVAGLVALMMAMEHPKLLTAITIVSSAWASPSGDGVENYTLQYPPAPLWSKKSQHWAFERLSYSHQHIDEALLEDSVNAANQPAHLSAVQAMSGQGYKKTFLASATKAKFRFFKLARAEGLSVPVQVIAGQNDPLITPDYPLSLFRIAAAKQVNAHFHIINKAGSFVFREQPDEFYRVLGAFQDGLFKSRR